MGIRSIVWKFSFVLSLISICDIQAQEYSYTVVVGDSLHRFSCTVDLILPLNDYFYNAALNELDITGVKKLISVRTSSYIEYYSGVDAEGLTMISKEGDIFVLVNQDIPIYLPTFKEAVLYHEMYHVISLEKEHCDGPECPYILQDGKKVDIEYVIRNWGEEMKEQYFKYLHGKEIP